MSNQLTCLITGGSSGIGFELAKLFAKDGYRLVIVSKPAAELVKAEQYFQQHYPAIRILTLQKDLSLKQSSFEVYETVKAQGIKVDVLVNNAGFATYGYFNQIDVEQEYNMIQLNVANVFLLTRLFLNDMLARNEGRILNVASIAGFQPSPTFSCYAATKAFVLNYSRAISFELKERKAKVSLTTLCPPATRTPFQKAAGMQNTNVFKGFGTLDADVVAKAGYKALFKGKAVIVPGTGIGLISDMLRRTLPAGLLMRIVRSQLK